MYCAVTDCKDNMWFLDTIEDGRIMAKKLSKGLMLSYGLKDPITVSKSGKVLGVYVCGKRVE